MDQGPVFSRFLENILLENGDGSAEDVFPVSDCWFKNTRDGRECLNFRLLSGFLKK
jgi:hypothetical protein